MHKPKWFIPERLAKVDLVDFYQILTEKIITG